MDIVKHFLNTIWLTQYFCFHAIIISFFALEIVQFDRKFSTLFKEIVTLRARRKFKTVLIGFQFNIEFKPFFEYLQTSILRSE